jgi:hypothetical protein
MKSKSEGAMPKFRVRIKFSGEADIIISNAPAALSAFDEAQRQLMQRMADLPGVTLEMVGPAKVNKEE